MTKKDDLKAALSQRKNPPPLQRGKGIQLSGDEAEVQERKEVQSQAQESASAQSSDIQDSQFRKNANTLESNNVVIQPGEAAVKQDSEVSVVQDSEVTEQQLKEIAKMLQKVMAKEQTEEKARQRKEDPADLLIQALADVQISIPEIEQFRKLAESQKKKVNQGVTIPESLFTIYKSSATSLTIRGKKTTMGDLMAKALIKYLAEDIIPELGKA